MKLLKQILILSLITWGFMACDRESALTPSGPENVYGDPTLPQGNHDYDNTIMDWFKKYNTLFLYKYVPHDLYYGGNSYLGGTYDPVKDTTAAGTNAQNYTGYFDVPADEDYVGFQLKLLNDTWLKFYSDEFLLKFLPKKVFLLDSLYWSYSKKGRPDINWCTAWSGSDFIAVTGGGERVIEMTPEEKRVYCDEVNAVFIGVIMEKTNSDEIPEAFASVTDYDYPNLFSEYKEYGLVDPWKRNKKDDWGAFLKIIMQNSYEQLTSADGTNRNNYLHPSFDVNGLIKKKYDVMIAYFKAEYDLDLQKIGDAVFK